MGGQERRVKGINVIDLVKALRAARKAGQLDDLDEGTVALLDERILVSSWYPFEMFVRLMTEAHRHVFGGSDDAAMRMGEFAAQQALGGVHSAFLRIGDPEATVRALERIWPTYFDFGEAHVDKLADGTMQIRITGYPDVDRVHSTLLLGWIKKAAELAGGTVESAEMVEAPWRGDSEYVVEMRLTA